MKRRGFLALLGALPFLRRAKPMPNARVEFPVYRWNDKTGKFDEIDVIPAEHFKARHTGVGLYSLTLDPPYRIPPGSGWITLGGPRET